MAKGTLYYLGFKGGTLVADLGSSATQGVVIESLIRGQVILKLFYFVVKLLVFLLANDRFNILLFRARVSFHLPFYLTILTQPDFEEFANFGELLVIHVFNCFHDAAFSSESLLFA